jgi:uncharacterized membrane protein YidH (DUF202 family)
MIEPHREPPIDEDEGMFIERTELAWSRTGIGLLVCVAALGRRVWPLDRTDHEIALAVVAVGAVIAAVGMVAAHRAGSAPMHEPMTGEAPMLRWISAGTFVLAIGAFVLGLFPPT